MLHVRELVRDDAFELLVVQQPHDALSRRDRSVLGLRPVANAFGDASGMTYTLGIGRSARGQPSRRQTTGAPAPTSCARYILRTILSENQYETKFMTTAKPNPSDALEPPSISPSAEECRSEGRTAAPFSLCCS